MVDPIPPKVKKAWKKWNIRGTILFSLSMQVFLILFAPYRKCTRNKLLIVLIWSAYLLADAAANFTVGLISNRQSDDPKSASATEGPEENNALLAFWAPFLLLHLGGPDTITAFALEDNELWLRHLLAFGFQAVAALYVFAQSLPNNRLWISTILLFVAGTIKYVERTRALYLASLDKLRKSMLKEADPGPNYAILMEEYASKVENKRPTGVVVSREADIKTTDVAVTGRLNDLEVVHNAYKYFLIFKGLVVDLIFSFRERDESRKFFLQREAEDAFRVIEVELNFIYEVLYTKVEVVHSILGYIFRGIAFGSILAALGLFHFKTDRHEFNEFDVGITYTLLLGAIALDVIALLMLIFSDWTFATIRDPDSNSGIIAMIFKGFLRLKRPCWRPHPCKTANSKTTHYVLATPILVRRWSGSLSSYNLLSYCLKSHSSRIHKFTRWPLVIAEKITRCLHIDGCYQLVVDLIKAVIKKVIEFLSCVICIVGFKDKVCELKPIPSLHCIISNISVVLSYAHKIIIGSMGLNDLIDEIIYVSREPFTKELWEFIFKELKTKASYADDPEVAKRISAARGEWVLMDSDAKVDHSSLMQYVTDVQYDESLLLWHIATDICYYTTGEKLDDESFDYREFSKLLSDYMLYLLIMQPTMMSAVGGIGKIRFRDTCAEAERFFHSLGLLSKRKGYKKIENKEAKACYEILSVNTKFKPATVKGDRSKSVLFDASILAKELNILEKKGLQKWKLLSRVWVELISYAASRCTANAHAQQLSGGGELISFIWLLMAQFGLGEQFQINAGHGWANWIV